MDIKATEIFLFLIKLSINTAKLYTISGAIIQGLNNMSDTTIRKSVPTTKVVGSKCTIFNEEGYILYKLILAIPELKTCLKNFFKSVLRL